MKKENWVMYYLTMITLSTAVIGSIYIAYAVEATARLVEKPYQEQNYTIDETIYRLLRKYEGVSYNKVYNIVRCESGWNSDAKNRQSTASGYFQFLYNTWYFEVIEQQGWSNLISPFDGERNLEGGIFLLSEDEDWRWNSSKHCWNN